MTLERSSGGKPTCHQCSKPHTEGLCSPPMKDDGEEHRLDIEKCRELAERLSNLAISLERTHREISREPLFDAAAQLRAVVELDEGLRITDRYVNLKGGLWVVGLHPIVDFTVAGLPELAAAVRQAREEASDEQVI